jgi:hypothetical protein
LRIEPLHQPGQLSSNPTQLFAMSGGQRFQNAFAPDSQPQVNLAPIRIRSSTRDEFSRDQAIGESDGTVMADLELFGEFADGDVVAIGKAFDGEQRLVLLCRDTRLCCGAFAELEELPQCEAKCR